MKEDIKIYVCLARFPPNPEVVPVATFDRAHMERSEFRVSDIVDVVMQGRVVSLPEHAGFRRLVRGG
jgi:hypothetical protein